MTTLAQAFPRLCAIKVDFVKGAADFSWDQPVQVSGLLALVTACQDGAAGDLDALEAVSLAVYEDLGEQRQRVAGPAQSLVVDFVQFWLVLSPLISGARRRRFSMARDWACRALIDNYAGDQLGRDVHLERLPRFTLISDPRLADEVVPTVCEYADTLFYVARVTGDLFDLTRPLAPYLVDLVTGRLAGGHERQLIPDWLLGAALSLLAWSDVYDEQLAGTLAAILADLVEDESYPARLRVQIGLLLAGPAGLRTSVAPAQRARGLLERYPDLLFGQERLGLLGSAYAGDAGGLAGHLDDLLAAIGEHDRHLTEQGASMVDRLYERGRLFRSYLGGPVLTLANAGDLSSVIRLLGRWQGVKEVREDLVLFLAGIPQGTLWIWREVISEGSTDPATFAELIAAANRALGLAITDAGAGEAGVPMPVARPGIPDASQAGAYERACERHLGLHGLVELQGANASGGLVVVPGLPAPVCSLAQRATGIVWPIATSLRAPHADRPIRRVALWPTTAAGVDEEVAAVQGVFEAAGIAVEVVREEQTVERFRELYARDDLDVLWLTSHGALELFRPEGSWLRINDDGDTLSLEDLLALKPPAGEGRRLLVLNACDSAAAAALGGLADFSIGGVLAGPTQAVIGHMWPIPVTDAAGFGAVLATALASGASYPASFGQALTALRGGMQGLLDALAEVPLSGELRDRLQRAADRPTHILAWGMPTFCE